MAEQRGRPKKAIKMVPVSSYVTPDVFEIIQRFEREEGRERSEVIRFCLMDGLEAAVQRGKLNAKGRRRRDRSAKPAPEKSRSERVRKLKARDHLKPTTGFEPVTYGLRKSPQDSGTYEPKVKKAG